MAYLYVSCYADAKQAASGLPYQKFRVAIGGVDATSPAIGAHPDGVNMNAFVRMVPDVNCVFERGPATPATTSASEYLPEGSTEYFPMAAGWEITVRDPYA